MILYLPRSSGELGDSITENTKRTMLFHLQILILMRIPILTPTITTAFCYGIVWASLRARQTERSDDRRREGGRRFPWSFHSWCHSGATPRGCCRRQPGKSVTGTAGDTGQPGILLVLQPLAKSSSLCNFCGDIDNQLCHSWCHRGDLLIQQRIKGFQKEMEELKWFVCHLGAELDTLMGTFIPYFFRVY